MGEKASVGAFGINIVSDFWDDFCVYSSDKEPSRRAEYHWIGI